MLRVGLTGGLASGKSFVGHALADLGCYLIEADKLGHEVMMPGAEAYDAIVREFGPSILDAEGSISRRKLSGIATQTGSIPNRSRCASTNSTSAAASGRVPARNTRSRL